MDLRNSSEISSLLASKRRTILRWIVLSSKIWISRKRNIYFTCPLFPQTTGGRQRNRNLGQLAVFPRREFPGCRSLSRTSTLGSLRSSTGTWTEFWDKEREYSQTDGNTGGQWKSTCWGRLLQIWWAAGIGETCPQPKRCQESPAVTLRYLYRVNFLEFWIHRHQACLFVFTVHDCSERIRGRLWSYSGEEKYQALLWKKTIKAPQEYQVL